MDSNGKAIYVTGSHTWSNLQDMGTADPPHRFDFEAYLRFLKRYNHNFIRLWRWEAPRWRYRGGAVSYSTPHPWKRTGPGKAKDGKPKFNLNLFNEEYFQRLRRRCLAALRKGIYVSIMLFEGHCVQRAEEGWDYHPFNPENNCNGIDGGRLDYYTLKNPKVLKLQEAYVRKVTDTVNDLDNVLFEICNEAGPYSTEWQYHMIRFVKSYELNKPKRHPVGMTFQYRGGSNKSLFESPADWISPNPEGGFRTAPPPNEGLKVVLNDTDHLWGEGGNSDWVWKSFTRGHNPLFMDRIVELADRTAAWCGRRPVRDIPGAESIRRAMGVTRRLSLEVNMERALPLPRKASSSWCLADPGNWYIVFVPKQGAVQVDLTSEKGSFEVRWIHPVTGVEKKGGFVKGGKKETFKSPFGPPVTLLLLSR